jgi:GAF domain-containing protein
LSGETEARDALIVGWIARHATSTEADLDMAQTLAGQATIALELADARAARQRLRLRTAIARDLDDPLSNDCLLWASVSMVRLE